MEVIPDLVVLWEERYYSVGEGDGSVEVCAELSTLQFTGTVEVDYATVADSAEGMEFSYSVRTRGMHNVLLLSEASISIFHTF